MNRLEEMKRGGKALGVWALGLYLAGGVVAFTGMGLALLAEGQDLWGWGDGKGIGFLLLSVGLACCCAGVMLMRLFRNRGLA